MIEGNNYLLFGNQSTNEVTVGPEDILGEFQQSTQNSQNEMIDGSAFINLERRTEQIESETSYLRSELSKPDPDENNMLRSLMNLPAGDEVEVLSSLRTNGDIYRLLDDLFSNPNVASQMGQLANNLESVVGSYPGIQDIIDAIRSRLS